MILACSACGARFLVDSSLIGPTGRIVRCGRCQNEWLATHPPDLLIEPAPSAPPAPVVPANNLPALREPPRRRVGSLVGWAALAAVLIGLVVLLIARESVVAAWPGSARYFGWLGLESSAPAPPPPPPPAVTLKLRDLKQARTSRDGVEFLVVEGRILNEAEVARSLPSMRGALIDTANKEVQSWTFVAPKPKLGPGESVEFKTELRAPAAGAASLSISFEPLK